MPSCVYSVLCGYGNKYFLGFSLLVSVVPNTTFRRSGWITTNVKKEKGKESFRYKKLHLFCEDNRKQANPTAASNGPDSGILLCCLSKLSFSYLLQIRSSHGIPIVFSYELQIRGCVKFVVRRIRNSKVSCNSAFRMKPCPLLLLYR